MNIYEIFTDDLRFKNSFIKENLNAFSINTIEAYEHALRQFIEYSKRLNHPLTFPFSEHIISAYINDKLDYYKSSNLAHFVSAIITIQKIINPDEVNSGKSDIVSNALLKVRRADRRPLKQAKPLMPNTIMETFNKYPWQGQPSEVRDKAMILIGWYGAMRRSEILNIRYEDITFSSEKGFSVFIPHSKTNKTLKNMYKAIPYNKENTSLCPVLILKQLLEIRGKKKGYLFRKISKSGTWGDKPLTPKGFDYNMNKYFPGYSSHSLRAGFITTCLENDIPLDSIMNQTHHITTKQLLAYNRSENIWINNAVTKLPS